MKTPEQIKEWLEKQEWYPQFRKHTEEYFGTSSEETEDTLNGRDGRDTIICAFCWVRSEEGNAYWIEINGQFWEWYDKEN